MTETTEAPQQPKEEVQTEKPVVTKVRNAWKRAIDSHREYREIRHEIQERLAWHGGGVYKRYVENMDKIADLYLKRGNSNIIKTAFRGMVKSGIRISGGILASTSAGLDLVINLASWPIRKIFPLPPKDPIKRLALAAADAEFVIGGAAGIGAAAEMTAVKGVREVAEATVTAPEVAAKMIQRKVYRILHPEIPNAVPKEAPKKI